ncbi:hypothetical protein AB0892_21475 [Streptomyces sp. NPDC005409]|uniref:hypothetical protein n=1 Tax=Streptomyces sp. NPDC005409 TaxID=3155342 RepID=UPI00345659D3
MSGSRRARTALTRALTVVCVVLLCVFGAGPAGQAAAECPAGPSAPSAPYAPAEPTEPMEGPSDPAADPGVRAAVRTFVRGLPGVRHSPLTVFHVKHPDAPPSGPVAERAQPALTLRAVRSVVLRC